MMDKSLSHKLTSKQLWYVATISSFVVGWSIGWIYLHFQPYSIPLAYTFWIYPVGIAGLTMSISQWALLRQIDQLTYLWVPIILISYLASTGAALVLAIPSYAATYTYRDQLVPFTPIALLIGPVCQWLLLQRITGKRSFRQLVQLCITWNLAAFLPIVMFYALILIGSYIEISRFTLIEPIDPFTILIGILSASFFSYVTEHASRLIENTDGMFLEA